MTTKTIFSALGAPMSLAWVHWRPVPRNWLCQNLSKAVISTSTRPSSGGCRFIGVARYLNQHWAPLAEVPVHKIGRADVAARLADIAKGSGPFAANRARAALSALYGWAIGEGLVDQNPVVGTRKAGPALLWLLLACDRLMRAVAGSAAAAGSAGDFVTSVRPGRSLYAAYPELAAPPVQARPFGRSVEHLGQGIVQTLGGVHGTSGRRPYSGKDRRRRK